MLRALETEAHLALNDLGDDEFAIVAPWVSALAEPPVALAEACLNVLFAPEAQAIILQTFHRGWDTSKAALEDAARFPQFELVDCAAFGDWAEVISQRNWAAPRLSFWLSVLAAIFNLVFGLGLACHRFPGRRLIGAAEGLKLANPLTGIFLTLVVVGVPFMVRSVRSVIDEIEREVEEARPRRGQPRPYLDPVILPMLAPSALTEFALPLAAIRLTRIDLPFSVSPLVAGL